MLTCLILENSNKIWNTLILADLGIQKAKAIKPCEFSINKTSLSCLVLFGDIIWLRDHCSSGIIGVRWRTFSFKLEIRGWNNNWKKSSFKKNHTTDHLLRKSDRLSKAPYSHSLIYWRVHVALRQIYQGANEAFAVVSTLAQTPWFYQGYLLAFFLKRVSKIERLHQTQV